MQSDQMPQFYSVLVELFNRLLIIGYLFITGTFTSAHKIERRQRNPPDKLSTTAFRIFLSWLLLWSAPFMLPPERSSGESFIRLSPAPSWEG